ncbi:MAG: ABC-2 family transporter protein [Planctomycetes bacterium]|nr:ABC-2 family transporter protein [Planctomycetota bacterium]
MRYLRLYLYFLRFSFSRSMEFRFDFFFRIFMDSVYYAVNLGFYGVLFSKVPTIGGWNFDQAVIFVAGYLLLDAIDMTVFSNNMWQLPSLINRGDLDYYLVRPVSTLYFVSLRDFAANSFVNLLMTIGILAWAIARYPGELGPASIAAFAVLLLAGCFLHYVLHITFLLSAFWLHAAAGVQQLFYVIREFSERPHQIYKGWLRQVLVTVLPVALFASIPAHALFDGLDLALALHVVAVAIGAWLLLVFVWSRGLRAYVSASS